MTDKELHRLKRSELLEMMLEQSREIDRLREQIAHMEKQLKSRELIMRKAGSIAEASLAINHVFADAQKAADLYVENIERICRKWASQKGAETEWDTLVQENPRPRSGRKGSGDANG